jgi:hypothetical protein
MLLIISSIILATGTLAGQTSVKETRNITGFTEIGFSIAGNLYIKTGNEFSFTIEGDKRYLEEVETVVRNGRLIIRNENNFRMFNNQRANVYITLPELKKLAVSGSGTAQVENSLKTGSLDLNVSGSGKIIMPELFAGKLSCSISGSGNIVMKGAGEIEQGDIVISGSGNYSGNEAVFKTLEVGISGSGNCTCNVAESIDAKVSGSGNISYSGNPKINARVSGSGHVRSR